MEDKLNKKIEIVRQDIQKRFKNCSSTIIIKLWDDGTSSVSCRYGTFDKLHISTYYNNKLTYEKINIKKRGNCMFDKQGNEYILLK